MGESVSGVFSVLILGVDLFSLFSNIDKWAQGQPCRLTQYLLHSVQNNPLLCLPGVCLTTADIYIYLSFTFTL